MGIQKIYILTHTCIYIYIYVYISICIRIYISFYENKVTTANFSFFIFGVGGRGSWLTGWGTVCG